ncbi:MAG: PilZ domain-containing protein [Deltaproteobacteria bacterium]|nr:PilZ domain-containing protein [Deltaproteobacteria bacterium]
MERYTGKERRKFPRLSANFVVSYKIKRIPDHYDLSQTKNVGQGGMLLTTNQKFAPGTQLILTVKFPFVPQRIEIEDTVVDSREVAKNMIYETRLSFIRLNKKFFQELGKFIEERLSD